MAFEKFTGAGRSFKPKLSIRKNGQLGLNYGAVERYGIDKFEYVELYYDKENNRIGLKLSNEKSEGAVRCRVRSGNASIPAKSFLEYYKIDYREAKRMEVQRDEAGMLIAKL